MTPCPVAAGGHGHTGGVLLRLALALRLAAASPGAATAAGGGGGAGPPSAFRGLGGAAGERRLSDSFRLTDYSIQQENSVIVRSDFRTVDVTMKITFVLGSMAVLNSGYKSIVFPSSMLGYSDLHVTNQQDGASLSFEVWDDHRWTMVRYHFPQEVRGSEQSELTAVLSYTLHDAVCRTGSEEGLPLPWTQMWAVTVAQSTFRLSFESPAMSNASVRLDRNPGSSLAMSGDGSAPWEVTSPGIVEQPRLVWGPAGGDGGQRYSCSELEAEFEEFLASSSSSSSPSMFLLCAALAVAGVV